MWETGGMFTLLRRSHNFLHYSTEIIKHAADSQQLPRTTQDIFLFTSPVVWRARTRRLEAIPEHIHWWIGVWRYAHGQTRLHNRRLSVTSHTQKTASLAWLHFPLNVNAPVLMSAHRRMKGSLRCREGKKMTCTSYVKIKKNNNESWLEYCCFFAVPTFHLQHDGGGRKKHSDNPKPVWGGEDAGRPCVIVKCDEWERRSSAEGYDARGGDAACANSDARRRRDTDGERGRQMQRERWKREMLLLVVVFFKSGK